MRCCYVCSKLQGLNCKLKERHFGVRIVVKLYVIHHVSKFITLKLITNYMH